MQAQLGALREAHVVRFSGRSEFSMKYIIILKDPLLTLRMTALLLKLTPLCECLHRPRSAWTV